MMTDVLASSRFILIALYVSLFLVALPIMKHLV